MHKPNTMQPSKRMLRMYGPRCPEYQPGCFTCEAWRLFDETLRVVEDCTDEEFGTPADILTMRMYEATGNPYVFVPTEDNAREFVPPRELPQAPEQA